VSFFSIAVKYFAEKRSDKTELPRSKDALQGESNWE